ncbi:MAG: hypothetical protein MSIBF_00385 [Candidatus Altiarchaeales archaeon IMC4]|nr:MAG: hypothetical protein MSIBF_00385 [Candidatus Altiarchaeales archaeon IMC4]
MKNQKIRRIAVFAAVIILTGLLLGQAAQANVKGHLCEKIFENIGAGGTHAVAKIFLPTPKTDVSYDVLLPRLILWNPDASDARLKPVIGVFLGIIEPMYVLAILVVAVYAMLLSTTVEGRQKAKSMLPALIVGMCLVTLAPLLVKILLQITHSVAETILSQVVIDTTPLDRADIWLALNYTNFRLWSPAYGLVFGVISLMLWWGLFLVLYLRYLLLMLFIALSPVTIFFYSFGLTKGLGRRMAEQTILWSAGQVAEATALVSVVIGWKLLGSAGQGGIGLIATSGDPTGIDLVFGLSAFFILILVIPMMVASFRRFLP